MVDLLKVTLRIEVAQKTPLLIPDEKAPFVKEHLKSLQQVHFLLKMLERHHGKMD